MKILFKKWDFWYWILIAIYFYFRAATNPGLGQTGIFGTTTVGGTFLFISIFLGVPALLIYIFLKVVENISAKIKAGQDKGKNITLLTILIMFVGYILIKMYHPPFLSVLDPFILGLWN